MKTPEEIKKGIRQCLGFFDEFVDACDQCPFCREGSFCKGALCHDALALIEHLEANVPRWISVEEQLPDNDAKYLVYMPDYGLHEVAEYYGDGEWLDVDFTNLTRNVSHWMPLPEPPKEEQ